MKHLLTLMSLCLLFAVISCQKDSFQTKITYPVLPENSYDYSPQWGGMHTFW